MKHNLPGKRIHPGKFRVAVVGFSWAVQRHASFHVHLSVASLVIAIAAALRMELWQWCVLVISIGGVITAELFNTAIEELVRVLHPEQDPQVGRVLDIAAAAVLVVSIAAAVAGMLVFIPSLWLVWSRNF